MSDRFDPYEPPKSDLEIPQAPPAYLIVGPLKLAVMSICTFGLYELYWCYRNWQYIQRREQLNLSPFWRAFFAPFWVFSLARHIREHANSLGIPESLSPREVGGLYLFLAVLIQLPDPYWLLSMLTFGPLVLIQNVATEIAKATTHDDQFVRFSSWNWLAIVIGGAMFILGSIGMFYPSLGLEGN